METLLLDEQCKIMMSHEVNIRHQNLKIACKASAALSVTRDLHWLHSQYSTGPTTVLAPLTRWGEKCMMGFFKKNTSTWGSKSYFTQTHVVALLQFGREIVKEVKG